MTTSSSRALIALLFVTIFGVSSVASALSAPAFAPAVSYPVGTFPYSVAIADFDGDGDADLAIANATSDDLSVLLGRGDGTFAPEIGFPAGEFPISVAAGDLDGDGDADLAVANNASPGTVSVLLGHGDGTFAPPTSYPAGHQPFSVAIADLNGDGDADLAVANASSETVSVLLGQGDGTFAPTVDHPAGRGPVSLALGDFDGDSDLDLVVPDFTNNEFDTISVLRNQGDGTFAPPVSYPAGLAPTFVATGDLDGDGDVDLVVVSNFQGNGDLRVLRGHGDGSFAPPVHYAVGNYPNSVAIVDLDEDGAADLAVTQITGETVEGHVLVLPGRGDGTFASPLSYRVGRFPVFVAAGDLDGNDVPDLVVANAFSNDISVLIALVGPPLSKEQCKGEGWRRFNNPKFKNQGHCIRFVNTGR